MKRFILALSLLAIFNSFSFAQGEGAMPVMTMQTSLPLMGAGIIGTAKPNNDPIGFYLNPAILGYSSQNNHASLFFMPNKADWLPSFDLDLTKNSYGFNLGYNFKEFGLPISLGFGYLHDKMDYGTFYSTGPYSPEIIGEFDSYDIYDVYSLGIGIDYYLLFNFGMSIKPFESNLSDQPTENEIGIGKVESTAFDYGAMIIAPISKLFFDNLKYDFYENAYIKPVVNFTLGYAISNIGDEVMYVDEAQKDPLSRTERLGYTVNFGLDAMINNTAINLFSYSFTAEVEDILLNRKVLITENDNYGQSFFYYTDGYQTPLSDINVWDNLVLLSPNDEIILHKGHTLTLFETLTLTSGSYIGRGYYTTVGTSGYGFSSEGISKIISNSVENSFLKYLVKHFVIEYFNATILKDYNRLDTELSGISLHMKNIEL